MKSNECIAIIPARSGSKRIPNKNIIDFNNKPMIAWTIKAALDSKIFKRVIVSTDSNEIAKICIGLGAEAPFLRNVANDEFTPVSAATLHTLSQSKEYWNEDYQNIVQLMPNCPLRNSEDIKKAYSYFIQNKSNFQISCTKFGWMNPWWAATIDDKYTPTHMFQKLDSRSQDLENLYCPTGAIWIANTNKLIEQKTFYGKEYKFFPIPWQRAIDIDDYEDLNIAKAALNFDK